jgi:cation diffusion facilitator CzcD-associated flavoprotein CzcO
MLFSGEGIMADTKTYDAVVIGAGFSGLYMLKRLRDELGMSAKVFERGGDVGGTWYWNRYPGARCDTESYLYCFDKQLLQDWEWSGKYPEQPEILKYLNHVADRFELRRDIQFDTRVTAAHWDDVARLWEICTDKDDKTCAKYLITAIGCLSTGNVPEIAGLKTFEGEWYHTGNWPHEPVDFSGKRVGVIGTGSSGVQSIPVIAAQAKHLTVFQRTAQYSVPARHETVNKAFLANVKANYDAIWNAAKTSQAGYPVKHWSVLRWRRARTSGARPMRRAGKRAGRISFSARTATSLPIPPRTIRHPISSARRSATPSRIRTRPRSWCPPNFPSAPSARLSIPITSRRTIATP